uniref:Uncharacterized protein n=1 Tax=Timema douglasi TaxID=61478 RepID=A0A7R8VQ05_TIMDO|nr:unnamed protein product [Timema douglasi]
MMFYLNNFFSSITKTQLSILPKHLLSSHWQLAVTHYFTKEDTEDFSTSGLYCNFVFLVQGHVLVLVLWLLTLQNLENVYRDFDRRDLKRSLAAPLPTVSSSTTDVR